MLCKLCILSIFVYSYNQYISSYLVRKNMYSSKHKFVNYMFRRFDSDGVQQTMHSSATRLYLLQDLGLHPAMLHKTSTQQKSLKLFIFSLHGF